MKKKIAIFIFLCFLLSNCSTDTLEDCLKNKGAMVEQNIYDLPFFDKITVEDGVELLLSQDTITQATIIQHKNLLKNISLEVKNQELIITNNTKCKFLSKQSPAKIRLTVNNLKEIYSKSTHKIQSENTLNFSNLKIASGLHNEEISTYFNLTINCDSLRIEGKDASYIKISGQANYAFAGFWSGTPRLDAQELIAKKIHIFQRSSNSMNLYPTESLYGEIYSTGNVVLYNIPPIVNVTELYSGTIIYPYIYP